MVLGLAVLLRPADWLSYLSVAREASTLPALLAVSLRNLRDAWPLLRPKAAGILGPP